MNKSIRNLIIFVVVTWGAGFFGAFLDRGASPADSMNGPGVLLWLVAPLLAVILLRTLGGDGWQDFGLRLNLRHNWQWLLFGLLLPVVVIAIAAGAALFFHSAVFTGNGNWRTIGMLVASGFTAVMIKNIFEEFSWRGYLTPRFEALRVHPFLSSLLTGLIWAGWHVPYYLYFLPTATLSQQTTLTVPQLIPMAFIILPIQALAYGELRLISKSVWPLWLMHNMGNAVSFALISGGLLKLQNNLAGALLSPGTEGLLHTILIGLAGFCLYRYRKTISKRPS
jgi:hypothetical protein